MLSGGIDSATCLLLSKRAGNTNRALTVTFHAIAEGEITAAAQIAERASVLEHRFFPMPELKELGDIGRSVGLEGLPPAYIPMRNAVYYSVAAAFAEEVGASCIVGGHNMDDSRVYEDTSELFFRGLQSTLRSGSQRLRASRLTIWRPLKKMNKSAVVRLAAKIGVPFELTWSCHRGGTRHCGRCSGCLQRKKAFEEAGVSDPLKVGMRLRDERV